MTQQLNLLDPALLPAREWCSARVLLAVAALLTLGTAAQLAYEHRALATVLAAHTVASAEPDLAAPHPLDAALAELQARIGASEHLLRAVGSFTELPQDNAARLRALVAAMPEDLWLQEVEFGVERDVRISGGATAAEALAGFSARLGALPAFSGLPLHVFALAPEARDDTPADGDVPAVRKRGAARYGFVLSSVDTERAAPKTP